MVKCRMPAVGWDDATCAAHHNHMAMELHLQVYQGLCTVSYNKRTLNAWLDSVNRSTKVVGVPRKMCCSTWEL